MKKTDGRLRRGPRPQTWKYPDPFDHVRHNAYLKMRSQAWFRKEPWDLTIEEFFEFWPTEELWSQRGKRANGLCMVRVNTTLPWSKANCRVVERYEQLVRDKTARKHYFTRTLERSDAYSKIDPGGHSDPPRSSGRKPRDQGRQTEKSRKPKKDADTVS